MLELESPIFISLVELWADLSAEREVLGVHCSLDGSDGSDGSDFMYWEWSWEGAELGGLAP